MEVHYLLQQTNCTIQNCRVRRNTPQIGIAVAKRMGVPRWNENWVLSYWCEFKRSNGIELTKAHLLWTQTQALSKLHQGLSTPDGLCIHFFGPLEGSRHDVTLLRVSGLLDYFESNADIFKGYYIYGDPAYPISKWIISGYRGDNLDERKMLFNAEMSKLRQGVEWNFGRMKTLWGFITYKMQQKVMLSNVGTMVLVAMFMTNCNCCYYRKNQISTYFNMKPPSLKEYLMQE